MTQLLLVAISLVLSTLSHAAYPGSTALARVSQHATATLESGGRPIVVFDLDDTLFDSRVRMLRVINAMLKDPELTAIEESTAQLKAWYRAHTVKDIGYYFGDILAAAQITSPEYLKKAQEFWVTHFFSDKYCAIDPAIKGSARYVQSLVSLGADVVYLTGRDKPRMGKGTKYSLEKSGFPVGEKAHLIMRPDKAMDELKFKQRVLKWIGRRGAVVGGFENEPRNINMMKETFPDADMVLLESIHSKNPDKPRADILTIREYY